MCHRSRKRHSNHASRWKLHISCLLAGYMSGMEAADFSTGRLPLETKSNRSEVLSPDVMVEFLGEADDVGVSGDKIYLLEVPTTDTHGPQKERFHIQGEFIQHQEEVQDESIPVDDTNDDSSLLSPPPTDSQPSVSSDVAASSTGDFVRRWTGITGSDSGWRPPDTVLAVGPSHVIEAVNSGFAVYSKQGTELQGYSIFENFMNRPTGWQGSMFDPRVIYDTAHDRFVMFIMGKDEINLKSYVWVAIPETSDPTQAWCRWRYDVTRGSSGSELWLDFSGMEADSWGVYITGNYFSFSSDSFQHGYIKSINPDIFAANCTGQTNSWGFTNLTWPSGGNAFSIQPAHPHSINSDEETFFVNTFSSSGNKVLLWRLSGDRSNSPSLSRAEINIPQYEAVGNNADQPGSSHDLDAGDARISSSAVYANKRVFFTLTDDVNNDGKSAGWLTVKLNTNDNSKEWDHLLWSGDGFYYFYPAITLSGSGVDNNLAVFGSWTDTETSESPSTQYASGLLKIYENQPVDGSGAFTNIVSGSGHYVNYVGSRNRWGDYSGAAYDWECGHAWGAVETATSSSTVWSTSVAAYIFDTESLNLLSVSKVGNGTITSDIDGISCGFDCSEQYCDAISITLTATPDTGYTFSGWSGGGCSGSASTCNVNMSSAQNIIATFTAINACSTENALMLADGNTTSGRLEICHNGLWGTVCDDSFSDVDAGVACRQLGYAFGSTSGNAVPDGIDPIWMDNVGCSGSESQLANCSFNGWGFHNCSHWEDVGVVCSNVSCQTGPVTINNTDHTGTVTYQSTTSITTSGTVRVLAGSTVSYEAAQKIELNGVFQVLPGSSFSASGASVNCATVVQ